MDKFRLHNNEIRYRERLVFLGTHIEQSLMDKINSKTNNKSALVRMILTKFFEEVNNDEPRSIEENY